MKKIDRYLQQVRVNKASKFILDNAVILDIGSSEGTTFEKLRKKVKQGIGIDPTLEHEYHKDNYRLTKGYFPKACPQNVNFDVITLLAVMEHIPADKQKYSARSCYELLKPKGKVVITVPSPKVDQILEALQELRLIDGMSLEEHYGFHPIRFLLFLIRKCSDWCITNNFSLGLIIFMYLKRHRNLCLYV